MPLRLMVTTGPAVPNEESDAMKTLFATAFAAAVVATMLVAPEASAAGSFDGYPAWAQEAFLDGTER